MRTIRLPRPWALAALILAGSCRSPAADAAVAEQLTQISDALVAQRDQLAALTTTVDSLAMVTARQDTIIRRMAAVNGVPVP